MTVRRQVFVSLATILTFTACGILMWSSGRSRRPARLVPRRPRRANLCRQDEVRVLPSGTVRALEEDQACLGRRFQTPSLNYKTRARSDLSFHRFRHGKRFQG